MKGQKLWFWNMSVTITFNHITHGCLLSQVSSSKQQLLVPIHHLTLAAISTFFQYTDTHWFNVGTANGKVELHTTNSINS